MRCGRNDEVVGGAGGGVPKNSVISIVGKDGGRFWPLSDSSLPHDPNQFANLFRFQMNYNRLQAPSMEKNEKFGPFP